MAIKIDKLIKSRRKTLALEINDKAELIVRAPLSLSQRSLDAFLREKLNWIIKKQEEMRLRQSLLVRQFTLGESFLFLGKDYELRVAKQSPALALSDYFYISDKYLNSVKAVFSYWYKDQALEKIRERVFYYANKYDFKFAKIKISSATKRWGSCSSQKNLNFAWNLIMAPQFVIDYVVVHELVHLKHLNHSTRFWNMVADIFPDYQIAKDWLNKNGYLLRF